MGFNSAFKGLKLLKTPGNERLNNLNDPILNVLNCIGSNEAKLQNVYMCFSIKISYFRRHTLHSTVLLGLFCIPEVIGSNSGLEMPNLTKDFLSFIQKLQANAWKISQIRPVPSFLIFVLPYSYLFMDLQFYVTSYGLTWQP
jgi:hypothetical protein